MRSQIDEASLEWFEGESFRGHIGEPDADRVKKLCNVYRAACRYISALDDRRNGDAPNMSLLRAEVALRDVVYAPLPHDRIEHHLRQLGAHHDPDDDWQDHVLEAVAPEQARVSGGWLGRAWRRVVDWISW